MAIRNIIKIVFSLVLLIGTGYIVKAQTYDPPPPPPPQYNPPNVCKIDKCDTLTAYGLTVPNNVIVFDGKLDEKEWLLNNSLNYVSVNVNVFASGANVSPASSITNFNVNNKVKWSVVWDSQNLYVGVKVYDSKLVNNSWGGGRICGYYNDFNLPPLYDAVELFITPEDILAENNSFFFHCIKPVDIEDSNNDFWTFNCDYNSENPISAISVVTDSGYTVEFKLPIAELNQKMFSGGEGLYNGKKLRIDIANDDADRAGEERDYQIVWNNYCGNQNYMTNQYNGLLQLSSQLPGESPIEGAFISGPSYLCNPGPAVYTLTAPSDRYYWGKPASASFPDKPVIETEDATYFYYKTGYVATVVFVERGAFEVSAAPLQDSNVGCGNDLPTPPPFRVQIGAPMPRIEGQGSVCPGQKNMLYYLTNTFLGATYTWQILGADKIDSVSNTTQIVDWADATFNVQMRVFAKDQNNCLGDTAVFYMRLNDTLYVRKPEGNKLLCANPLESNVYSISGFVNSDYNWLVNGGDIVGDTNTNIINVNWVHPDFGDVRVSVRSKEFPSCFGQSDSLKVRIISQPIPPEIINIYSVSTYKENDKDIEISIKWEKSNQFTVDSLTLYRKENDGEFQVIGKIKQYDWKFYDKNLNTSQSIYYYYLTNSLTCNFDVSSVVQNSTLLKILKDDESGKISLSWNPVTMWAKGINKYQIFKKVDNKDWELAQETTNTTAEFVKEGFKHQYRVLALSNEFFLSKPAEIYTNIVYADFLNTVEILGNVLTPNNDNVNDAFVIKNITSYPVRNLKIYNRWGGEILQTSNYNNDWNANNQPDGMYYYHLEYGIDSPSETKKGWIQVIR